MKSEFPVGWVEPVAAWLAWLRVSGRSSQTLRLRRHQLCVVACAFPEGVGSLSGPALIAWLAEQGWVASTLRSEVSGICSFLSWAERNGLVAVDLREALPRVSHQPALPKPCPRWRITFALERCDAEVGFALRLAADVGLRRGEIAVVHSRDLMTDLGGVSLLVHGKGARERVVPLPADFGAQLVARLSGDRWLFPGGVDGHTSADWIGVKMKRALGGGHTAHSLRHSFATRLYGASRDLFVVQRFLGHSKPETTMGYVALADDALRKALDMLPAS